MSAHEVSPQYGTGNIWFDIWLAIDKLDYVCECQKVIAAEWTFAISEVGIPQFQAQSASCATSARAEVAKRFNKLFLAIAQVALRFKENKSFLHFIALRTEKIYNSVRIIALRTEKNLVACALLRCALSEVEILRCALSD